MANNSLSTLCESCARSLLTNLLIKDFSSEFEEDTGPLRSSHTIITSGVTEGCYVCTVVWRNMKLENFKLIDGNKPSAQRILRSFERAVQEDGRFLLKLSIVIPGPLLSDDAHETQFRLLPCTGNNLITNTSPFTLLQDTSSSEPTLRLAFDWYQHCRRKHTRCNISKNPNNQKRWLPTRLLEVVEDGQTCRLIMSEDLAYSDNPPAYLTLSYRWGEKPQKLLLKSSNMQEFRSGLKLKDLPKTFQDLFSLSRRFSIPHFWIDALCIIQDSAKDWGIESSLMGYVYSNSACNIMACASDDPQGGLFRDRNNTDPALMPGIVPQPILATEKGNHFIFDKEFWNKRVRYGSLYNRGWIFQERLLAPRVLYFAEDQVMWECLCETKCESFPEGIPYNRSLKKLDVLWHENNPDDNSVQRDMILLTAWNKLVKEYSQCTFTVASDKLPAFSGVSRLFEDVSSDEYLAGLWKSHLLEQLDWRVLLPVRRASSNYMAPSWSWAAVDGQVIPHGVTSDAEFLVVLRDVSVKHDGINSHGKLSSGKLCVNGALLAASVVEYEPDLPCGWFIVNNLARRPRGCRVHGQFFRDSLSIGIEIGKIVSLLPIKSDPGPGGDKVVVCIVLEPVLASNSRMFRRIGMVIISDQEVTAGDDAATASKERPRRFWKLVLETMRMRATDVHLI